MIRIYLALCLLGASGLLLIATGVPVLIHAGAIEAAVALIGLHAHYTQE